MLPEEEQMVAGDSDVNALCREMMAIEQEMGSTTPKDQRTGCTFQ